MNKTTEITNQEDVIDSRDIIERIKWLDGTKDKEEQEELKALEALEKEAKDYSEDWEYGATLIRDSYFTRYAEELCKDCGDLPRDIPSYIEIDWEATAKNIQQDYTRVDFNGIEYWIR